MLLKPKDDIAPRLAQLDSLLRLPISPSQRMAIDRERAMLLSGDRAERDAAFEIDFRLEGHKHWVVIHDLRLEHKDRVAQIDHLLIFPTWEFYVVETKAIRTKVKIEDGQWCFLKDNHWHGMPNPVEQNARHILVLREVLRDFKWLPRTMGVPVVPRFINVILVPPNCLIWRKENRAWVMHMDEFVTKVRNDFNIASNMLNLVQMHSGKHARVLGEKLVAAHRPLRPDYSKRFRIKKTSERALEQTAPSLPKICESCGHPLKKAEASYCRNRNSRFAGKLLCQKCQEYAPADLRRPTRQLAKSPEPLEKASSLRTNCAECGVRVDSKVVAFCQLNRKEFAGRILCRKCQPKRRVPDGKPA